MDNVQEWFKTLDLKYLAASVCFLSFIQCLLLAVLLSCTMLLLMMTCGCR